MTREEKNQVVSEVLAQLTATPDFYVVDIAGLNAGDTGKLRRECFENNITLSVVKNTLFLKALQQKGIQDIEEMSPVFEGPTAIMYTDSPAVPAKLIKKLQKAGAEKPVLKGAYVQECVFVGADKLQALCDIKSKEELLGGIIASLQAPVQNVVSALQSAGQTIAGVLKTLEEKGE